MDIEVKIAGLIEKLGLVMLHVVHSSFGSELFHQLGEKVGFVVETSVLFRTFYAGCIQCQQTCEIGWREGEKKKLAWLLPNKIFEKSIKTAHDKGDVVFGDVEDFCRHSYSE